MSYCQYTLFSTNEKISEQNSVMTPVEAHSIPLCTYF